MDRIQSRTPSDSDDEVLEVNGIILEELHLPSHQNPEAVIKARLRHEAERVTVGQVGTKLVYGNPGGFGILERLERLEEEFNRQKEIFNGQKEMLNRQKEMLNGNNHEIQDLKISNTSLEVRVQQLSSTSEGYLSIRRRFLDVYKRDIKGMDEVKGSQAIQRGNMVAHEGDAVGDAVLFDRDQRTDDSIYVELYGLSHHQVRKYPSASGGLFLVLNAHATRIAQGKPLSADLKIAFNFFLTMVEEHWPQLPNENPTSPLGLAYYAFWKAFNEQASS